MVFSSLTFLFLFLPATALLYFIVRKRPWRNGVLLLASLVFYAWGEPKYVLLMLAAALVAYLGGLAMAALAGNFFWGGTRGATLSVGADNALYVTERRPLDELCDSDGIAQCLDEFSDTIFDWRERSALYA